MTKFSKWTNKLIIIISIIIISNKRTYATP